MLAKGCLNLRSKHTKRTKNQKVAPAVTYRAGIFDSLSLGTSKFIKDKLTTGKQAACIARLFLCKPCFTYSHELHRYPWQCIHHLGLQFTTNVGCLKRSLCYFTMLFSLCLLQSWQKDITTAKQAAYWTTLYQDTISNNRVRERWFWETSNPKRFISCLRNSIQYKSYSN